MTKAAVQKQSRQQRQPLDTFITDEGDVDDDDYNGAGGDDEEEEYDDEGDDEEDNDDDGRWEGDDNDDEEGGPDDDGGDDDDEGAQYERQRAARTKGASSAAKDFYDLKQQSAENAEKIRLMKAALLKEKAKLAARTSPAAANPAPPQVRGREKKK